MAKIIQRHYLVTISTLCRDTATGVLAEFPVAGTIETVLSEALREMTGIVEVTEVDDSAEG